VVGAEAEVGGGGPGGAGGAGGDAVEVDGEGVAVNGAAITQTMSPDQVESHSHSYPALVESSEIMVLSLRLLILVQR
jgi:hypothetical protein